MSEGFRLVKSSIERDDPRSLLKIDTTVLPDEEREVVSFVVQHYRRYRALPSLATLRENTGRNITMATPEPPEYYLVSCYNRFSNAQARAVYADLRESLSDISPEALQRTGEHAAEILRITRRYQLDNTRPIDGRTLAEMVIQRQIATQLSPDDFSGIDTGWNYVTEITGGWQDSDLISLVARPGEGKTYALLHSLVAAIRSGKRVSLLTTEMGAEQMGRRLTAIVTGISPTILKLGRTTVYQHRQINEAFEELRMSQLLNLVPLGFSSTTAKLTEEVEEFGPDMVFLDGGYLLTPSAYRVGMSRSDKVANLIDDYKMATIDYNKPLFVTLQFNRLAGKGGKDGSLETIGMTDAVGQHSSIVMSIGRDEEIAPAPHRVLKFLKGREGEEGHTVLRFSFAPMDMGQVSATEIEEAEQTAGLGY